METLNDGAWVAAVAAPWAIAPHPNFSQSEVSAASVMALVARCRPSDLERYTELLPEDPDEWASELVDASKRSVLIGSIRQGADDLWKFTERGDLPMGARIAAAMFAAVAEIELDEYPSAIQRLDALAARLEDPSSASSSLASALLHQQIAARKYEVFDYAGALLSLGLVDALLTAEGSWDPFTVSPGIGWDSDLVQDDIREAIASHCRELRARVEGFEGTTWVQVVKSRATWPDLRGELSAASRDRKYVEHLFEETIGPRKRGRTFRNEDPVISPALETLLTAELCGDVNAFMKGREALAQVRILRESEATKEEDTWEVRDSLRLLRQARAKDSLKRALEWVYMRGPGPALLEDATMILGRSGFPSDISELDLMVLASAAPYLDLDMVQRSLGGALSFIRSPRLAARMRHIDERAIWNAVVTFLPETGLHQEVAEAALEAVNGNFSTDLIEGELLRLLETLNWDAVTQTTVMGWRSWGELNKDDKYHAQLAVRASKVAAPVRHDLVLDSMPESGLPLYLVAHHDELPGIAPSVVARAESACIAALEEIRESASHGSMSFGGTDSGELATLFARLYESTKVWHAVARFLTDAKVAQEMKARSLIRIADYGQSTVPEEVASIMRSNWASIIDSELRGVFLEPDPSSKFAEALRAGVVLHILSRNEAIAAATEMAGSISADERTSAAELLPDVSSSHQEWEWGQLLLLQLTRDIDPTVRSQAARSLALVGKVQTGISPLVYSALLNSLRSGGIRVPLFTLHGLQRMATSDEWIHYSDEVRYEVSKMTTEHPARIIREAARHVIDRSHHEDNGSKKGS